MKQVDVKKLHLNFLLKTDYLGKPFNFSEGKFNSNFRISIQVFTITLCHF